MLVACVEEIPSENLADTLQDDGSFVMYFALTTAADSSHHCVGAATSATILGPYQPISTPLFCDLSVGGAIDPAGFVEPMTTSTRLDRRTTNQRYVGKSLGPIHHFNVIRGHKKAWENFAQSDYES